MDPESNHASMTSGTRRYVPSWPSMLNVTSSMKGRCGSNPDRSRPASSDKCASDSTQIMRCGSASLRQIGRGVPQYRLRESAQSILLLSQSPYRPCLIVSGYQLVRSFSRRGSSLMLVVRIYQVGRVLYINGV